MIEVHAHDACVMRVKNKSKIWLLILSFVLVFPRESVAGVATIFEGLNFVTYQSHDSLNGFYYARSGIFSCGFLFVDVLSSPQKNADSVNLVWVKTFDFVPHVPAYTYDKRDPRSDIDGTVYVAPGSISLKTDSPHAGCQSAAGMFDAPPGERGASVFAEVGKLPASGIFVVGKKAFFYRIENEVKTKEYLLPGSFVLATKKKKGFSFVRYVDPDSQIDDDDPKRVVSGWIRTSSLVNPFPLKGKQ